MKKDKVIQDILDKQRELEMNNSAFARYLGVSRQWISNLHGDNWVRRPISIKVQYILVNRLGMNLKELEAYNRTFITKV